MLLVMNGIAEAMAVLSWLFRLDVVLLAALIALQDWRHMRIANLISLTLLAPLVPLLTARLLAGSLPPAAAQLILAGWALCFVFQRLQVFGGGDAKVLMAVVAYFPDQTLMIWLLVAILVGSLLMMVRYDRFASFRRMFAVLTLAAMGTYPTVAEIRVAKTERGQPLLFAPALAFVIFWLFVWKVNRYIR